MASTFGSVLKVSLFGESHGPAVGCVIDSPPPGVALDLPAIGRHMARRAPGQAGAWSTTRKEPDVPEILSGFFEGRTTGTPLAAVVRNTNVRSGDYSAIASTPRPGHGDITGRIRYGGCNDPRGGGHFSARATAGLCFAGAVAMQALRAIGVSVRARVAEIAGVPDGPAPSALDPLPDLSEKALPVIDDAAGARMVAAIEEARRDGDSVGGIVEVRASGLPPGIGAPFFDRVETRLGAMLFSINAVRGVEFGDGFAAARRRGSENNDQPVPGGPGAAAGPLGVSRASNRAGGAEGGISTGLPVVARVAFKPTPSISRPQRTVDLATGLPAEISVPGRHDPCVVPRAVPLVESAVAFALWDMILENAAVRGAGVQP